MKTTRYAVGGDVWIGRLRVAVVLVLGWLVLGCLPTRVWSQVDSLNASHGAVGRVIPLGKLSEAEARDLMTNLRVHVETYYGYTERTGDGLPRIPRGVSLVQSLQHPGQGSRVIQLGLVESLTQGRKLWMRGVALEPVAENEIFPLQDELVRLAETGLEEIQGFKKTLERSQLAYEIVQLNYIDVAGALEGLKGFGFETVKKSSEIKFPVTFPQLPLVAPMPQPTTEQTALLGKTGANELKGAFELSVTPSVATPLPDSTNLSPASQLIILYHPGHPRQYSKVLETLRNVIDRPARQIFVEGLVLEISEEGIDELGIDWGFKEGQFVQAGGDLRPRAPGNEATFELSFDDLRDLDKNWVARLRGLVEEGKAEVMSRPSVLTLDNRQATIRVGTDIPIATAQEGLAGTSNKIAFKFQYLATGISLNIRPRITASGDEIGMLVDTIVSSVIPNGDLELRSVRGEVLASAPTVATRRVQTYARIENNTPFIIGGLVSKELTRRVLKVPLLAEIPYLGRLFQTSVNRSRKREVIIVLTPYVLVNDETTRSLGRFLPKDQDRFDEFGNVLFRDFYRIRNEDVFDLEFLIEDPGLRERLDQVRAEVAKNRDLAQNEVFAPFRDGMIPGEKILVERMIYEVVKRLSSGEEKGVQWLDEQVELDRVILFDGETVGGYDVSFLDRILTKLGDGASGEGFFAANPGKALAITFTEAAATDEGIQLRQNPIPEVALIDCPDSAAWTRLLAEYNEPLSDGRARSSIILHDRDDLIRLRRVIVLDRVIRLNGGEPRVRLENFSLGKVLLIPEPDAGQVHLLDETKAKYFYHTEQYYAALLKQLFQALEEAEASIRTFESTR